MDDLGRGVLGAEGSVLEPEVERDADHDDQVGLGQGERPGPGDEQRMAPGEYPAGLPVGDHGQRECLRALAGGGLGAAEPHVGAEDEHRPPGRPQQGGDGGHVIGLRGRGGREAAGVRRQVHRLRAEDRLEREVAEHRSPVRGQREPERLVDRPGDPGDRVLGPRPLGDRGEQRHVIHLLQRALAPQVVGRPPAQHDHRGAVEPGPGHRADAVGDAGPGGDHRQPGRPGQPGDALGGEDRGLLVPHVHQPHRRVGLDRPVVEREDVPAGEGEHRRHAVPLRHRDGVRARMSGKRGHQSDVTAA